ncbi:MAG TPA: ABC transporter substrate-binding protein, partial [Acidimicrobiales bacterium]|nr:ABC transporter substrate-binding protein [Acidimicrobiales bacterium]
MALVILAVIAAACSSGSSSSGPSANALSVSSSHTLKLAFGADMQVPDPDIFYEIEGNAVTTSVYEGLVRYANGSPTIDPALASSWTISPDGMTYTFTLRPGVTFHDGTPVNSAAAAFSFARRTGVNSAPAYMLADVTSTETPDPLTFVVHLDKPVSAFMDYLASPYGPKMMSPTGLKTYGGTDSAQTYLRTHDLGTGAYTLTQAQVGRSYQLKAYPHWWGGTPYFQEVDLPVIADLSTQELEFNQGQLAAMMHDLNAPAVKSYLASSSAAHYSLPTFDTSQIYFNPNSATLKDQAVRVALQQAINIKSLTDQVFSGRGQVATGTYAPGLLKGGTPDTQKVTYDPSKLAAIVPTLAPNQRT